MGGCLESESCVLLWPKALILDIDLADYILLWLLVCDQSFFQAIEEDQKHRKKGETKWGEKKITVFYVIVLNYMMIRSFTQLLAQNKN